ncbi:hypothetical protein D9Q98_001776 [Chlorella vulgaris]|uniref:FAD/NAD(P)-binding domain-containing protein n=1 Tax=Chlorella vulgaris TaxID=3077 RepID=A0A9D4Z0A4_CHLVU|nr:hypothetical protein D9Q98_001776 [Chlorella vulgaris]
MGRAGAKGHAQQLGSGLRVLWRRVAGPQSSAGCMGSSNRGGVGGTPGRRALLATCAASPGYTAGVGAAEGSGPRVCILGGGFGGLYTAVKLESLMWPRGTKPQVTLIDQSERFVFKPLLYELVSGAASEEEVAPHFAQLLGPYPVTFVQGRVHSVQPEHATQDGGSTGGGVVTLSDGASVPYDWLVVSLGAETSTFGLPGVKECALPFSTYEDAQRVAARLQLLEELVGYPEVVVVGGGYAGVELAAVVAERLRGRARIKLVTSTADILPGSPQGNREAAHRVLADQGVSILTGAQVTEMRKARAGSSGGLSSGGSNGASSSSSVGIGGAGTAVGPDLAKRLVYVKDRTGQQEVLEADMVLWSAGQAPATKAAAQPPPGALKLPFSTNSRGAMQTDATLRVLHHSRVFALGDVAVSSGGQEQPPLPATAQVAFQQADYVAWNLWASINNKPLLGFSYQHLGDMMSLGTTGGAVTLPISVPPQLSAAVAAAGPLAGLLKAAGVKLSGSYGGGSDGVTLEGPLGAAVRRAAYLYRQPTLEQQLRVAGDWAQSASKQLRQVLADAARK